MTLALPQGGVQVQLVNIGGSLGAHQQTILIFPGLTFVNMVGGGFLSDSLIDKLKKSEVVNKAGRIGGGKGPSYSSFFSAKEDLS
jgi:hypothetical protein